jgi:hypothetical protein
MEERQFPQGFDTEVVEDNVSTSDAVNCCDCTALDDEIRSIEWTPQQGLIGIN